LAKRHDVLYIEGIFDEGIRSGYQIIEDSGQFKSLRLTAYKSFHLNYQKPTPEGILLLKKSLKQINPIIRSFVNPSIYIHHPFWDSILSLKKKSFIFDRACTFTHHHNATQYIIDAEKKLLKNALTITAPHAKLLRNKKDIVIKNGVDFDMFKDTSKMIQTCDVGLCWIKKPVMGYIGTLDERVDEVLLGSIATAFPTASIVLVGNTDYRPIIEVAEKFPNIFPVGKQPYKKLPLFLQSFDILISPLKYNKSIPTIHPELSLYLSSGKPIVAPPATAAVANGLIYKAKTHAEWMITIAEALKEKPRSKKKYLRIAAAKKLNWKVHLQ
jgi:glycosyltransferase involved in cell wall biosynthesis